MRSCQIEFANGADPVRCGKPPLPTVRTVEFQFAMTAGRSVAGSRSAIAAMSTTSHIHACENPQGPSRGRGPRMWPKPPAYRFAREENQLNRTSSGGNCG